jgi:hypothetical protein
VNELVQGRRLEDGEWLSRAADAKLEAGDYGRCWMSNDEEVGRGHWEWFVCCPDGSTTRLWTHEDDRNGNRHVIEVHKDGSITVCGSILGGELVRPALVIGGPQEHGGTWHGYLRRGKWYA